jgi:hypothetical protein
MKFFRNTLILFIVLVCAGTAYWYFVKKKGKEKEEAQEQAAYLFEQSEKEVVSVTLKKREASNIVMEKVSKGPEETEEEEHMWLITSPVETGGSSAAINSLISSLMESKREEVVWESLEKREEYGLDEPELSIEFTYKGEETVHGVDFGIESLDGKKIFASVRGKDAIYLVPVSVKNALTKDLFDLRDKRISPYESEDLVMVTYLSAVDSFVLERKDDDEWYFVPEMLKASETRVDMFTGNVRYGNIAEVVEEEASQISAYGLDKPRLIITLKIKDGSNFLFMLGDPVTKNDTNFYYATRSSDTMVFQLNEDLVQRMVKTKFELKDRSIFPDLQSDDIDTVTISAEGTEYAFTRKDDEWVFSDTGEELERGYKIDNIVRSITTAEYEVVDPVSRGDEAYSETGIENAPYTVTFTFSGTRSPLTVEITEMNEETNKLWLTPDGGNTAYCTNGYFLVNFPESREELLE